MARTFTLALVVCSCFAFACHSGGEQETQEKIVFPGRLAGCSAAPLVVLGTSRNAMIEVGRVEVPNGNEKPKVEVRSFIDVEKVVWGKTTRKSLQLDRELPGRDTPVPGKRRIYLLERNETLRDGCYWRAGDADPQEESHLRELCRACFDEAVLSAKCVFVGKQTKRHPCDIATVEVLRPLTDPGPKRGARVSLLIEEHAFGGARPWKIDPEERVYLVSKTEAFESNLGEGITSPFYHESRRYDINLESDVKAALKRRAEYPVREVPGPRGTKIKQREITFLGPLADAIPLLASQTAAADLGMHRLVFDKEKSRQLVIDAIEGQLTLTHTKEYGGFRKLHNLIRVLGKIETPQDPEGRIQRLIDLWLAKASKNDPPGLVRGWYEPTPRDEDAGNHALTWLFQELESKKAHALFGKKIVAHREKTTGHWRDEIQHAMQRHGIKDQIELTEALKQMKDAKVKRSPAPKMWHSDHRGLSFSNDGQYLAAIGNRKVSVWRVKDWGLEKEIKVPELRPELDDLCVWSPDGKFIYIAGREPDGYAVQARLDWQRGEIARRYSCHNLSVCSICLVDAGRLMVSRGDDGVCVNETDSGKVIKHVADARSCTVSPDGRALLWGKRAEERPEWNLERIHKEFPDVGGLDKVAECRFSPAGRYLLTIELAEDGMKAFVAVRDLTDGARVKAKRATSYANFCISADGKRMVLGDTVLTLPDLEVVSTLPSVLVDAALSPDGKILAVPGCAVPTLFDVETGKQIQINSGHSDDIRQVHFCADGKTMCTVDSRKVLCFWDRADLKLRDRVEFPSGLYLLSVREPHADLVLCNDREDKAWLVESATGKKLRSLEYPADVERRHENYHWLAGDRLLVTTAGRGSIFNIRTGKLLCEVAFPESANDPEFLSGNKREEFCFEDNLYLIHSDHGSLGIKKHGWRVNLVNGKRYPIAIPFNTKRFCGDVFGRPSGNIYTDNVKVASLVRRSKFYAEATPNHVAFFEMASGSLARTREFPNGYLRQVAFTDDGDRYAVLMYSSVERAEIVRVHDLIAGTTLGAFRVAENTKAIRFSPDGKELAVVHDDGTFSLFDLSGVKKIWP